ncbi:hypothetical protein QQ045_008379 [Rhodiola kirilowii]
MKLEKDCTPVEAVDLKKSVVGRMMRSLAVIEEFERRHRTPKQQGNAIMPSCHLVDILNMVGVVVRSPFGISKYPSFVHHCAQVHGSSIVYIIDSLSL